MLLSFSVSRGCKLPQYDTYVEPHSPQKEGRQRPGVVGHSWNCSTLEAGTGDESEVHMTARPV